MTRPADEGFYMPAEWERHHRCWMAWPCREQTWNGTLSRAQMLYAEIAQAISQFEPVSMICPPAEVVDASLACGSGVEILPLALDDSWLRDTGPGFLLDGRGRAAGVQWQFNGWGGRLQPHAADAALAGSLLRHLNLPAFEAPLVLEGGAVLCDGEGTLITTEQCLLNPNRNPNLDRRQIEELLKDYLGVSTVIWLAEGYQDDETDGHADEIACFVRPGVVLALTTDDPGDGNFASFHDNLDRLQHARDAQGRELEVIPIRQPARRDQRGRRLTLSYTNLYIANDGVIIPGFHDPADSEAFRTLRRLFPGRAVVQIPVDDLVVGGGGIHCITLAQPAP